MKTRRPPYRCTRARALPRRAPGPRLVGRATNGAAVYVITGRDTMTPNPYALRPAIAPDSLSTPIEFAREHRRRPTRRVRLMIGVLIGAVIALFALAMLATAAGASDDPPADPPAQEPTLYTPTPMPPRQDPRPPTEEEEFALAADVIWTIRY